MARKKKHKRTDKKSKKAEKKAAKKAKKAAKQGPPQSSEDRRPEGHEQGEGRPQASSRGPYRRGSSPRVCGCGRRAQLHR